MAVPTNQELLDAAKEALAGVLARPMERYTVGTASYGFHDIAKLRALIAEQEEKVAAENGATANGVAHIRAPV